LLLARALCKVRSFVTTQRQIPLWSLPMKSVCVLLLTMFALGCGSYRAPMGVQMTVTSLMPSSATANSGQFPLTVNGSGFASTSVVYFGGSPVATAFGSGTQLTATIPATAITTTGMKSVYVRTTGGVYGTGQSSNALNFMVN
jgi:hypothetical protein